METVRINVDGTLRFEVKRSSSDRVWVAWCDPLSLTVEAERYEELQREIVLAIDELFRLLLEKGELDAFLLGHGWNPVNPIPREEPIEGLRFDVPFDVHNTAQLAAH